MKSSHVTDDVTWKSSVFIILKHTWRQMTSDYVIFSGGEKHARRIMAVRLITWLQTNSVFDHAQIQVKWQGQFFILLLFEFFLSFVFFCFSLLYVEHDKTSLLKVLFVFRDHLFISTNKWCPLLWVPHKLVSHDLKTIQFHIANRRIQLNETQQSKQNESTSLFLTKELFVKTNFHVKKCSPWTFMLTVLQTINGNSWRI